MFSLLALALVYLTAEAQMFQYGKPFNLKLDKFDKTLKSPVTRATGWEYFTYTKDNESAISFGIAFKTVTALYLYPVHTKGKNRGNKFLSYQLYSCI